MRYITIVSQTVFLFSLLVWGYVVVIQVTHPEWVSSPMTHHDFPLLDMRVDDTGILAFILAVVSFLTWRLTDSHVKHMRRRRP